MTRDPMKGMFLTYRPPVCRHESAVGYVYRAMHVGGHVRMKSLATTLVDRATIQPPWTLPSNLNRMAEGLTPVFSSGEEILWGHTCLSAHLPFAAASAQPNLFAHAIDGRRHRGLAAAIGLTGRAIESKPRMAMCLECVADDTNRHGFAFWHREHALAGVGYCPHHGVPLMVGCGACRFSQPGSRMPLLPREACWCGARRALSHPAVSRKAGAALARMADYGLQLLEGALRGRSPCEVGAYYFMCAHRSGYAAGRYLKSSHLPVDLQRRYPPGALQQLNASVSNDQNWVQKSVGSRLAPRVLGRNLLLFDFFEQRIPGADDFALAAEYVKQFAERGPVRRRATPLRVGEAIGDAQRDCPDVPQRGRRARTDSERAQYWDTVDIRTEKYVLERRQALLAFPGGFPKAITKTALLKGAKRGNELSVKVLASMPRTRKAIEESVETRRQFQARYALAILRQPEPEGEDRVWNAHASTGLTLSEVDSLNLTVIERKA